LLASLEERFTYKELDCFLEVVDKVLNVLEDNNFANKATEDIFDLFWEPIVLPAKKALSCF